MGSRPETWAEVAVPVPLRTLLTYLVPPEIEPCPRPGVRVLVTVGARRVTGIVVSLGPARDQRPDRLRPLLRVLDREPVVPDELLSFVLRSAEYYFHPPGEALRAALPPGMATSERGGKIRSPRSEPGEVTCARRRDPMPGDPLGSLGRARARLALLERIPPGREVPVEDLRAFNPRVGPLVRALVEGGWIELVRRREKLDPLIGTAPDRTPPPELTSDQERAFTAILAALGSKTYQGFLLHGVTGSGKTEVYLRVIDAATVAGRGALVMVPEIALTPQLVARFRGRLGDRVAVVHSGLSRAQRVREWSRIKAGDALVVVGARSAVFAPVRDLGVVVVDEEHDPSFKQNEGFRYHGRDLAMLRARRAGAVVVLGSATPSLESTFNTTRGRLCLLELPDRVTPRPLPEVELVDLKRHRSGPLAQTMITTPLTEALGTALETGGQSILFLNRRGYAPVAICGACGEPIRCLDCSVAMTYHRRSRQLECHYCPRQQSLPLTCPSCQAPSLHLMGAGTEKVEEVLPALLGPGARVGRLDSDVAPGRLSEGVLDKVRSGEINVLVGTQLVTKGHDIPGVTLVGVLLADASLDFPDFRAAERTFQLLTQVAGRAGRGEHEGRVLIQTFIPEHPVVRFAAAHDYRAFYRFEMRARREAVYPPLAHLAAIGMSGPVETKVKDEAARIADAARRHPEARIGEVRVTGPAPAPIARVRGRFRYRIMLKAINRSPLRRVLGAMAGLVDKIREPLRAFIDVDPVHML